MVLRKSRKKSPVRRRRSPVRRSRSPVRRRRSPVRRRRSPSRRRKSPVRRRRSPVRRRRSPVRRRRSPVRRRKSPVRRRKSPARRRKSPVRRRKSPVRRRKSRPYVEGVRNSELRRYGLGPNKWYNYRADIDPLEKYHYEDIIKVTERGKSVHSLLNVLNGYIGPAIISIHHSSDGYDPNESDQNHPVRELNYYINNNVILRKMFVEQKPDVIYNIDITATREKGKLDENLRILERLVNRYITFLCTILNSSQITIQRHFQTLIPRRATHECPFEIEDIEDYKDNFITNGILDHAINHGIITHKKGGNKRRKLTEDFIHAGDAPSPAQLRRQGARDLLSLLDAAANDDE